MKKIITTFLCAALLLTTLFTVAASASFGSGAAVISESVRVIKTGLFGRKLTFSECDFKSALCIDSFKAITITKLPKSSEGTLLLAGRRVGEGTVIKRKNLPSLVFIPASKDVAECKFYFTIDEYASGEEIEFLIRFTDKINYEPKTDGVSEESIAIETQREIGINGKLYAADPEGDAIEYIIVSYPKNGTLTLKDKNTGEYRYTPQGVYTGKDSFIYVARDEWGNYSEPCEVKVAVTERMSEVVYRDMTEYNEYNAAVKLTAMGVMSGTLIGNDMFFDPERSVTRAQFVAMAMKSVGIYEATAHDTYFDDNGEISAPLLPYVYAAQKMGIINGEFKDGKLLFRPNDEITRYEAALIAARLISKTEVDVTVSLNDLPLVPVWARDEVLLVYSLGIMQSDGGAINPSSTLSRRECAECLIRLSQEASKA